MNPKRTLTGGLLPVFVAALALGIGTPVFAQEQHPSPSCPQIQQDLGNKIGKLKAEWDALKQKPPSQTNAEFQNFAADLARLNIIADELHRRMPGCRLLPYQKIIEALADELIAYQESRTEPATPAPNNGIRFF